MASQMKTDPDYFASIEAWQGKRLAHLTAEDGWLNVIGRFWLDPGSATVGAAGDNDIVLSVGPAHAGTITVNDGGAVFAPADTTAAAVHLQVDSEHPPRFSIGQILFEVTSMDGRHALRARDKEARERLAFPGLRYFSTVPEWRKRANWISLDQPIELGIDTVAGIPTTVRVTRKAEFFHAGVRHELLPTHGTADAPMFVFRDLTSRSETYGAARFLYGEDVTEDHVVLDFNKAFNPPCAFTVHAVCPLPPPGNILPIRIEAGELAP